MSFEHKPSATMEEEIVLLSLFPEEVWLIILARITSRGPEKAYEFFNKTFPFFRNLLHPNLTEILFSSMISVLHNWYQNRNQRNNTDDGDLGILPFRKVCRAWKNYVDLLLERRLYATDFSNVIRYDIQNTVSNFIYDFSDVARLQAFQQQFAVTHLRSNVNPFMTAAIKFNFADDADVTVMQDFLQECVDMLTNYGTHVHHCVINMQTRSVHRCLKWLRHTLNLMPNLKSLRARNQRWATERQTQDNLGLDFVLTIPRLRKLEFIELRMLPTIVSNEVLVDNGHVPKVELTVHDETEGLPHLCSTQQLAVSLDMIAYCYQMQGANYPRFHWKQLTKLELDQRQSYAEHFLFLSYFLEYHLAETLEELRLFFPNSITEDMTLGLLKLKRLQVLKLHLPEKYWVPKRICSLHFIEPLTSTLKELSVWREFNWAEDIDSDECFGLEDMTHQNNFFSVRNNLQKCYMWATFPQLETLAYICSGKEKTACTKKQWRASLP